MQSPVLYIHGQGGSPEEAGHYKRLLPRHDVIGFDYRAQTPWEAKEEFPSFFTPLFKKYGPIILIANSIGAFFAMSADVEAMLKKAFFISPIVDMEKLICDMLSRASATEAELQEKHVIHTEFGEDLSWEYLSYVREHPIAWSTPTEILYGGRDGLTSHETVSAFSVRHNAQLTVMEEGEHWFHTEDQMRFLDNWLQDKLRE